MTAHDDRDDSDDSDDSCHGNLITEAPLEFLMHGTCTDDRITDVMAIVINVIESLNLSFGGGCGKRDDNTVYVEGHVSDYTPSVAPIDVSAVKAALAERFASEEGFGRHTGLTN
jgi:hypothetical protein